MSAHPQRFSRPGTDLVLVAAGALALLVVGGQERARLGRLVPPLDDTYIHLRLAYNLAIGRGPVFNPGEVLPVSTSPLWVALLVPAGWLGRDAMVPASVLLSALSALLLLPLIRRLGLAAGLSPPLAVLAAALGFSNGRIFYSALSGMETDLFAAACAAAMLLYLRRDRLDEATGLTFGLATLVRPEGHLLFAVVLVHQALRRLRDVRPGLRQLLPVRTVLGYALAVSPFILFCLATTGSPFPTTFGAKHGVFGAYRAMYLDFSVLYFRLENPVAAVMLPLAVIWLGASVIRKRMVFLASPAALVAGWPLIYLAAAYAIEPMPFQFCRYQIPLLPWFPLLAVLAAGDVYERLIARFRPRRSVALGVLAVIIAALSLPQLANTVRWREVLIESARNQQEMHDTVGRWLGDNTAPGETIATMDVGAIGFYSDRRIIDLLGILTPEVMPYIRGQGLTLERSRRLLEFLRLRRPDYLVLFPTAFPGLAADPAVFRPIYEASVRGRRMATAPVMVVYKCEWKAGR